MFRIISLAFVVALLSVAPGMAAPPNFGDCVTTSIWHELSGEVSASLPNMAQVTRDISRDSRPILIISDTHFKQRTGVVTLMENLQKEIGELTGDPNKVRFLTSQDLPGINTPSQNRRVAFLTEKKLDQVLEEIQPQAIHIMVEGAAGNAARKYLVKRRIPFTTSYTTRFPEYAAAFLTQFSPWLADRAQLKLSRQLKDFHASSSGTMVATPSLVHELSSKGYDPEKIKLWSRGVDTQLFNPAKSDPTLYADLPRPISVYSGRVVIEKNIEDFLKMDIPGTKVVIGDGTELAKLKKQYPNVVFMDRVSHQELPKYLASADRFVFPSVTDTFGQAQLEANAAGIPVVAYQVPGPMDVIRSPESGVLAHYDAKDPRANVKGLEQAWREAGNIPTGGPRSWAEKWSWRNSAQEFLSFLQRLPRSSQAEFGADLGPEFIEAEHRLTVTTPFFSHPTKLAGLVFPSLRFTGKLNEVYTPASDRTFNLPSTLIPKDEIAEAFESEHLSKSAKNVLLVHKDGKDYIRFFVHPAEAERARSLFQKYEVDPVQWVATATSSARSLIVRDLNHDFEPFFVKSSISQNMGRYKRAIDDERAVRAVKISDEFERIHRETGGKLGDSGKTWDFFRESFSAMPKEAETGGYIYREKPGDLGDDIVLPWYALISKRDGKPRWIDRLYQASGRKSMADFVWKDLTQPLVDLHDVLAIENGLTTELHQQNTLVRIDRKSMKVKGLLVRDMDAHFVDFSLRAHRLDKPEIGYGDWNRSVYLFRYGQAQGNQFKSYIEKLRMESLQWTLKYVLSKSELDALLAKADEHMVQSFNRQYPDFAVSNIGSIEDAWRRLHESVTTPDEKASYEELERKFKPDLKSRILNSLRDRGSRKRFPQPTATGAH